MRRHLVDKDPDKIAACVGCDLPYDSSKFTVKNIVKTIKGRLQVFAQ